LRLWTEGSAWFSSEQGRKGRIAPGQFADLAVLDADYFSVPDEQIKSISAQLTLVGGRIVHGDREFKDLAPPLPAAMPEWSPVRVWGGYQGTPPTHAHRAACSVHRHTHSGVARVAIRAEDAPSFWGALGCACFAF
jgi:hypothetical protein